MAGRPRTMARRMHQLLERYYAIDAELHALMPKQYLEPTNDTLGKCWQRAVRTTDNAFDELQDLACFLEFKADAAENRAQAATVPSHPLDDPLPSRQEHPTDRAGTQ